MTGTDPTTSRIVYVSRGPIASHSRPNPRRAKNVMPTAAIPAHFTWSGDRFISVRIWGMNGASPNQARKHRKNANQLMWNARIWGVLNWNRVTRVALPGGDVGSLIVFRLIGMGKLRQAGRRGGSVGPASADGGQGRAGGGGRAGGVDRERPGPQPHRRRVLGRARHAQVVGRPR